MGMSTLDTIRIAPALAVMCGLLFAGGLNLIDRVDSHYEKLKNDFLNKFKDISNLSNLKKLESDFLGKNGEIRKALQSLKELEVDKRKDAGNEINEIKSEATKLVKNKKIW